MSHLPHSLYIHYFHAVATRIFHKLYLSYSTRIFAASDIIVTDSAQMLRGSRSWAILQSVTGVRAMLSNRICLGLLAFLLVLSASLPSAVRTTSWKACSFLSRRTFVRTMAIRRSRGMALLLLRGAVLAHLSAKLATIGDPTAVVFSYKVQSNSVLPPQPQWFAFSTNVDW